METENNYFSIRMCLRRKGVFPEGFPASFLAKSAGQNPSNVQLIAQLSKLIESVNSLVSLVSLI